MSRLTTITSSDFVGPRTAEHTCDPSTKKIKKKTSPTNNKAQLIIRIIVYIIQYKIF